MTYWSGFSSTKALIFIHTHTHMHTYTHTHTHTHTHTYTHTHTHTSIMVVVDNVHKECLHSTEAAKSHKTALS